MIRAGNKNYGLKSRHTFCKERGKGIRMVRTDDSSLANDIKYLESLKCPLEAMALILEISTKDVVSIAVATTKKENRGKEVSNQQLKPVPHDINYGKNRAAQEVDLFARVDSERIKRDIELYTKWKTLKENNPNTKGRYGGNYILWK